MDVLIPHLFISHCCIPIPLHQFLLNFNGSINCYALLEHLLPPLSVLVGLADVVVNIHVLLVLLGEPLEVALSSLLVFVGLLLFFVGLFEIKLSLSHFLHLFLVFLLLIVLL